MTHLETMERYLRAQMARRAARPGATQGGPRPFITISRQAGAGGHHLASALLERFSAQDDEILKGWQIFDRKLCEMVADDSFYSDSLEQLLAEEYRTKTDEMFHQILRSSIDQRAVMERVFRVVRATASVGRAIIIGRAGSEVTNDMHGGVHVRLIAPETVRIHGVMDFYGLDENAAREESKRLDSARARLLKTHFKVDIDDPLRYDVVFNTGTNPIGMIADAVTVMLLHKVDSLRATSAV